MQSAHTSPVAEESQELEIKRVLVLEDDVTQAILMKRLLEDSDFMVTTVENGADGLREILAFDFDVIVCDMLMPKMPGDMFYLAVSRAKPHLCERFVFITGFGHEPRIAEFLGKVKGQVLHKPVSNKKLVETIRFVAGQAPEQ
jgi:CheY-like chemotaxis protein